jgi:hypothetical protein
LEHRPNGIKKVQCGLGVSQPDLNPCPCQGQRDRVDVLLVNLREHLLGLAVPASIKKVCRLANRVIAAHNIGRGRSGNPTTQSLEVSGANHRIGGHRSHEATEFTRTAIRSLQYLLNDALR